MTARDYDTDPPTWRELGQRLGGAVAALVILDALYGWGFFGREGAIIGAGLALVGAGVSLVAGIALRVLSRWWPE